MRVSQFRSPLTSGLVGASVSDGTRHLGVAWDTHPDIAVARAIGEARERRWANSPPPTRTFALKRVGDVCAQFPLAGVAQFVSLSGEPYSGSWLFHDQTQSVYVATSTAGIDLPAGLVWLGLPLGPGLPPLRETSSNGLAFSSSHSDAADHARWELFERDVAMRLHLGGAVSRPVSIPSSAEPLVSSLGSSGVVVDCAIIEPYVAIAAVRSERVDLPRVSVATAARPCAEDAIRAAVLEALQTYHFAMKSMQGSRVGAFSMTPRNQQERAVYWARAPGEGWRRYLGRDGIVKRMSIEPDWESLQMVAGEDGGAVVRALSPRLLHLSPTDQFPVHVSSMRSSMRNVCQTHYGVHPFV